MKNLTILLIGLWSFTLSAQSITDLELTKIAEDLSSELVNKMSGHNLVIADFVDMDDQPTDLGKYLAEEFTYTLLDQSSALKVVDRTHVRKLLEEAKLSDKGRIGPGSLQVLGRQAGVSAVVYGKLFPVGNVIKLYVKVAVLESQTNEISIRGELTRTPTLEKFLTGESENKSDKQTGKEQANGSKLASYNYKNIQIDLKRCYRSGGSVIGEFKVKSKDKADTFILKVAQSKGQNSQGVTYRMKEARSGSTKTGLNLNLSLEANQSKTFLVQMAKVPLNLNTISFLQLACKSTSSYGFIAEFQNITVQ